VNDAQPIPALLCPACGLLQQWPHLEPGTIAKCCRCDATLARETPGSLHLTAAFSLAALILYIPANLFPILELDMYGAKSHNTVWDGTVRLYKDGDYVIATIVFLASIAVPLLKLLGLFCLVISTQIRYETLKRTRYWLFWIIEKIGRWAMLDVFVVAMLVSLVKLKKLATIIPGPGLLAFSFVVVFTILASAAFDPKLLWDREERQESAP